MLMHALMSSIATKFSVKLTIRNQLTFPENCLLHFRFDGLVDIECNYSILYRIQLLLEDIKFSCTEFVESSTSERALFIIEIDVCIDDKRIFNANNFVIK